MKRILAILSICILSGCCSQNVYKVRPADGDSTAAIQEKLDLCFSSGGGKVVLQKGDYNVGGLQLKSNTTLYLKSGARLIGSRDCADYRILDHDSLDPEDAQGRGSGVAGSTWNDAMIRIYKAENVAIIGEPGSVIDGANSYNPKGEEQYRGVHGISAHKSSNLTFKGYTIRNTGNWAHSVWNSRNAVFEDLEILAGHDGVHVRGCDSVRVVSCTIKTGDDCIAGFDNRWVQVRGCTLNTSCSAFRFGGTHVRIDDCTCYGPGTYPHRGSLTQEQKQAGAMAGNGTGRRNMLSVFTYFADKSRTIREKPGDIVITNLTCENADRFLHYNFSGNETWQKGMPLEGITFRNVSAKGIKMPLCAYSDESVPFNLVLENCSFAFEEEVPEFIRGAYFGTLKMNDVTVEGIPQAPLVRFWAGDAPVLDLQNVSGVSLKAACSEEEFHVAHI